MSALGHKRTSAAQKVMSALPPKADIGAAVAPAQNASRTPSGQRGSVSFMPLPRPRRFAVSAPRLDGVDARSRQMIPKSGLSADPLAELTVHRSQRRIDQESRLRRGRTDGLR